MRTTRFNVAFILMAVVASSGCRQDFQERSQLQEVRVLAMVAAPLEVDLSETITVEPVLYLPDDQSVTLERWTFCPINFGADLGYRCILEACNVELESPSPMGSVTFSPGEQLLGCVQSLVAEAEASGDSAGTGGGDDGEGVPEALTTVLFYDVVTGEGETITTLKEIPLYVEGLPEERNAPPVITSVTIDGAPVNLGGATVSAQRLDKIVVDVEVDESSLQPYVDNVGNSRVEEAVVSFYATKGLWEADRRLGSVVTNTLDFYEEAMDGTRTLLEPPQGLAAEDSGLVIYAVVRDGRGGQSVAGPFTIELTAK